VKDKKPRGRQNLLDNCQLYGIPASAGMTAKNRAFLMFVSPAKLVPECLNPEAGVQFEALKRKSPPTNDV
jgi:hypothetical protein